MTNIPNQLPIYVKHKTLLKFPFIKDFFDKKLDKKAFLSDLEAFTDDLEKEGIDKDDRAWLKRYAEDPEKCMEMRNVSIPAYEGYETFRPQRMNDVSGVESMFSHELISILQNAITKKGFKDPVEFFSKEKDTLRKYFETLVHDRNIHNWIKVPRIFKYDRITFAKYLVSTYVLEFIYPKTYSYYNYDAPKLKLLTYESQTYKKESPLILSKYYSLLKKHLKGKTLVDLGGGWHAGFYRFAALFQCKKYIIIDWEANSEPHKKAMILFKIFDLLDIPHTKPEFVALKGDILKELYKHVDDDSASFITIMDDYGKSEEYSDKLIKLIVEKTAKDGIIADFGSGYICQVGPLNEYSDKKFECIWSNAMMDIIIKRIK